MPRSTRKYTHCCRTAPIPQQGTSSQVGARCCVDGVPTHRRQDAVPALCPKVDAFTPDSGATARSVRTLCIDPVQRLVLRDRVERGNGSDMLWVETTTYSSYTRDTDLPASLFQFQVPTGYFEDDGPQPDLIVENGVYRLGMPVSAPTLASKIEPSYTAEALQARVSGIVLVSFQVTSDGNPDKVTVVRGLGHGLDQKAVEAVGQWRFRPGTKDGVPVTVGPLKVAVSFRLP